MRRYYPTVLRIVLTIWLLCGLRSRATEAEAPVTLMPAGVFDLGQLRERETREVPFELRNTGGAPLEIRSVRAGCSCTAIAEFPAAPIPPSGTGKVILKIFGRGLPEGEFERAAFVEFERLAPATLRFKGVMVRDIRVTPGRDISLGAFPSVDEAWRRRIVVAGNFADGRELELGTPVTLGKVNIQMSRTDQSRYELVVTPRLPMTPGAFREEIRIPVLEPAGQAPEVIRLRAEIGLQLLVAPAMLDILPGDVPFQRDLRVSFCFPEGEKLTAPELIVILPAEVTAVTADTGDGRVTVKLTFSPNARAKGRRGVIELRTPRSGAFRVPYYVLSLPEKIRH